MADNPWASIVGMVTGALGMIFGGLAYRASKRNRSTDLRLQLRRDVNQLRIKLENLPELIERAKQSRQRVLGAQGLGRSGASIAHTAEVTEGGAHVEALRARCGDVGTEFSSHTDARLEADIGSVHALFLESDRLEAKYNKSLSDDDQARYKIRDEHVAIAAARIARPDKLR